jgi:hypothetical protein
VRLEVVTIDTDTTVHTLYGQQMGGRKSCEIGWAMGLKYTEGLTRLRVSVATVSAMAISMTLLGVAMRTLPLGTAYAVWTGHRHSRNRERWHSALR